MTDGSSFNDERSSFPLQRTVPQLPAAPKGNQSKSGQISENTFSPNRITLTVGPEGKVYEINEHILNRIPFFKSAFKKGVFLEGVENKMSLPEDDPVLFDRMTEFLCTGDYFPHLIPSPDPCDGIYKERTLFQHKNHLTAFSERVVCDDKFYGQDCKTVELPIEIVVDLETKTTAVFGHMEERLGRWQTTEATHHLFEQEVLLFCMAEKYMMDDLKELSYRKISMFPQGPKALAVLADHIHAKVYRGQTTGICNINYKMHEVVSCCMEYHQRFFDEWRSRHRLVKSSPYVHDYAEYMAVLEREMTSLGATLFHAMANAKESVEDRTRIMYGWWKCADERIAVLQSDFEEDAAKYHWLDHAKQTDAEAQYKVPNTLHSDNLFKGFEFCESRRGDTISKITVDKPIKGLAYGFNVRCEQWGFYPRKQLRFLETTSWRGCFCDDCQPPSFRDQGLRIYMHDPNDEGLPYRPGNRQKEIETARKARD
ncbi:MAG: hypothetical protein M1830_002063 [Pleopsidium flavum]|nr:MAG: hypothetical protein M1830_002063 [Pleopsidium flavum]